MSAPATASGGRVDDENAPLIVADTRRWRSRVGDLPEVNRV